MTIKKIHVLTIVLIFASIVFINSINAYFTDGDTKTNVFTIGRIGLTLEEPNWTPPEDIEPGQEIEKDPQVINDGVNDEFVFLEVYVPYENIIVSEDDGTRKEPENTELFNYTITENWTEFDEPEDDGEYIIHKYVYGTEEEATPLKPDETTPPLFNSVKFCNAIEDQDLEESEKEIIINVYGIQTENVNGEQTEPFELWSVLTIQRFSGGNDSYDSYN